MIDNQTIKEFWGKTNPFHPLLFHMIDVGCVAKSLLGSKIFNPIFNRIKENMNCNESILLAWLPFLMANHDIGKCAADFQDKGGEKYIYSLKDAGLNFRQIPIRHFRHNVLSAEWIRDTLIDLEWERKDALMIYYAILGHHGKFSIEKNLKTEKLYNKWNPYRIKLYTILKNLFLGDDLIKNWKPKKIKNYNITGLLFTALLVLSDWIASNHKLFMSDYDNSNTVVPSVSEYFQISKDLSNKVISILDFDKNIDWSDKKTFTELWPQFESLRPVQESSQQISNLEEINLVLIEAPMGEGKTESAIHIATQWIALKKSSGIYIALPTSATSDQMFIRIKKFLNSHAGENVSNYEKIRIKLIHGMAWIVNKKIHSFSTVDRNIFEESDDDTLLLANKWFRPLRQAFFAPYSVGTIDQALMSVLRVKFGFLRLLGLTGKVLIIDEIHAYDAYMTRILVRLLQWASELDIPVIMLSATLPVKKRQELFAAYQSGFSFYHPQNQNNLFENTKNELINYYPLITTTDKHGNIKLIPVKGKYEEKKILLDLKYGLLNQLDEIAELVVKSALKGKCVCVIVNTVKNAQGLFKIISNSPAIKKVEIELLLFHARFPAKRRAEIGQKVLKLFDKRSIKDESGFAETVRPRQAILVATQVVEQSLDIDFDEMFSEIAPIDLLLQRLGRMHRHNRVKRNNIAKFTIFLPVLKKNYPIHFGSTEKIYSKYYLLRTIQMLSKLNEIILPHQIRDLIEYVYDDKIDLSISDHNLNISKEELNNSKNTLIDKLSNDSSEANKYLIPEPISNDFSLAKQPGTSFKENENHITSYFYPKTRLGDTQISILLLDSEEFIDILTEEKPPEKEILQHIMMNLVNIPKYWLQNISQYEDFMLPFDGPKWIHQYKILRIKNGYWKAYVNNNKIRIIKYNEIIGLEENFVKG